MAAGESHFIVKTFASDQSFAHLLISVFLLVKTVEYA